jgi:hypothetical protein
VQFLQCRLLHSKHGAQHATSGAITVQLRTCSLRTPGTKCVGLARTLCIRCMYNFVNRELTQCTVIHGVYI